MTYRVSTPYPSKVDGTESEAPPTSNHGRRLPGQHAERLTTCLMSKGRPLSNRLQRFRISGAYHYLPQMFQSTTDFEDFENLDRLGGFDHFLKC